MVDSVIDTGAAVDAEVVLGLADIDLVYLRVGALLAAADRVFNTKSVRARPPTSSDRGDAWSVAPFESRGTSTK